jgi:hypothetical protein
MMKLTKNLAVTALVMSAFSFQANADTVSRDYTTPGDGLITFDTKSNMEWLDVSIFVDMKFSVLQGVNQWTEDGFYLATDQNVFDLYKNAGITYIVDQTGTLNYGESHSTQSVHAVNDLYDKLGGGKENFGGNMWIHGILADDNNNGLSNLAKLLGPDNAVLNGNGDQWGETGFQKHASVGAFFVRPAPFAAMSANATDVPAPVALGLLGFGLLGLSRLRR